MYSVVLVEDHPTMRMAVRSLLTAEADIRVVHESGQAADVIDYIREHRVDLVILDLELHGSSGLPLLGELRTLRPGIKVLVLSAQDEEIFASRALMANANGYISKSKEPAEIMHAVRTVLGGYVYFPVSALARERQARGVPGSALTNKELTVLQLLAKGLSNQQIAHDLQISHKTVSTHKARIQEKLGLRSLIDLAEYAKVNNIIKDL
ncbi:response regulator [Uliginosibacterium sp. sgz301328]|uniref:response regulator n=1 Tax=Uliginosibacterium sp. sgz301328 TaxID=3243764 RepID=UPI00359DB0A3